MWCCKVFSEPDEVFGTRRRSSRRFREHLGQEGLNQTIRGVARKEQVGEGLVRRCVTEEASKGLILEGVSETPEYIGVDEFSVKKGHIFNTVVCDLKAKRVMTVIEGKGSSRLAGYLRGLKNPERVKAVSIDMSNPFHDAVRKSLPKAKIVVDKFHVIRHFNQVLDKARFSDQGKGLKTGRKRELYKNRFTLLKAEERLTDEEKKRLIPIFWDYPEVRNAWQIKENLRRCYRAETRKEAEFELTELEDRINRSPFKRFKTLKPTILEWREEILNYQDYPITNGFVEGKNNRIKTIKRMAYGYRNINNLGLRIMAANSQAKEAVSH
jgi:transposase